VNKNAALAEFPKIAAAFPVFRVASKAYCRQAALNFT